MATWRVAGKRTVKAYQTLTAMQGEIGFDYMAALVAATPATVRAAMREAVK